MICYRGKWNLQRQVRRRLSREVSERFGLELIHWTAFFERGKRPTRQQTEVNPNYSLTVNPPAIGVFLSLPPQHADDPDSAGRGCFQPLLAMDSAGSHRGEWSFHHLRLLLIGGINEFFLDSDEDEQIGMSRVAADPDSDDEVLAEILFRGQAHPPPLPSPRCLPRSSSYTSRGVRSDDFLWDKPVEDFFSSENVDCVGLVSGGMSSDVSFPINSDDVEDFWRTQDEWVVSSWKLYPKSSVHAHIPPSYCLDVVVARELLIRHCQACYGNPISFLASDPIACTARQMVFSSHRLTSQERVWPPLQRLWCVTQIRCWLPGYQNLDGIHFPCSCWDEKWLVQEQTALGKDFSNPITGLSYSFLATFVILENSSSNLFICLLDIGIVAGAT
ncbi:hypothetical protein Tco_0371773 [Tanacetum coccineum]